VNLGDWPALSGAKWPRDFTCRRAAYGKINNATTDFRWIGASSGFSARRKALREIFLPASQAQGDIALWWSFEGRYYASFSRKSRAEDPVGRRGLETQILEWAPDGTPAALAALAILPAAASLSDADWFDSWRDPQWLREDYETELPAVRIPVSDEVESAAVNGLEILRSLGQNELTRFYSLLMAGFKPATLSGFEKPMPPQALAALLLPAPSERSASWSLAGWPVSSTQWSAVICSIQPSAPERDIKLSDSDRDLAAMMAGAVRNTQPRWAAGPSAWVTGVLNFARNQNDRWLPAHAVPDDSIALNECEDALVEAAIRKVDETPLPPYLESGPKEVLDGFRRHMELRADLLRAWLLVVRRDSAGLTYWFLDEKKKERLELIAEQWSQRGKAQWLRDLIGQPSPPLSANTP